MESSFSENTSARHCSHLNGTSRNSLLTSNLHAQNLCRKLHETHKMVIAMVRPKTCLWVLKQSYRTLLKTMSKDKSRKVAREMTISRRMLSYVLAGKRQLDQDTVEKVAQWLHGKADSNGTTMSLVWSDLVDTSLSEGILSTPQVSTVATAESVECDENLEVAPELLSTLGTNSPLVVRLRSGLEIEFVLIPSGTFQMGSPPDEERCNEVEEGQFRPLSITDSERRHEVFTAEFYLSKYPVTQEQYAAITGNKNPSHFSEYGEGAAKVATLDTSRFPVENVSWFDAIACCNALSMERGRKPYYEINGTEVRILGGNGYRLPTEAEWEYACRAESRTPFHFGLVLNGEQANCDGRGPYGTAIEGPNLERTSEVGTYPPNAWGLFDMHGNVWEWCEDYVGPYDAHLAKENPVRNKLYNDVDERIIRGGSWYQLACVSRAAQRNSSAPWRKRSNRGFRLAFRLE
jgi:formylglycine-generating enzyme required for sulfatase activity